MANGVFTKEDFLEQVRNKYPEYLEWEDEPLYNALVNKYPEYKDIVTEEEVPSPPEVEASNGSFQATIKPVSPDIPDDKLYTDTADNILQSEIEKQTIIEDVNKDNEDFYNQNVETGVIDPKETSQEDLKKEYSPFKLNIDPSKVPSFEKFEENKKRFEATQEDITIYKTPEGNIEQNYNELLKQGYLRKRGTDEDMSLEEYSKFAKEDEAKKFNDKYNELIANKENSYFIVKGKPYIGTIKEISDNNVIFKRSNGNERTFIKDDVQSVASLSATLEDRNEKWDSYLSSNFPNFNTVPENIRTILYQLAAEDDEDSFIEMYSRHVPLKGEEYLTSEDFKKLSLKGIPDTPEYRDILDNNGYKYDIVQKGGYSALENIMKEDGPEFLTEQEAVMLKGEMFSLFKDKVGVNPYFSSERVSVQRQKTANELDYPDQTMTSTLKNEASDIYSSIKTNSPDYLLLKLSNEELGKTANEIYNANISKFNIGDIKIDLPEDRIPESFESLLKDKLAYKYRIEKARDLIDRTTGTRVEGGKPHGETMLDYTTFHDDGSISYEGTWELSMKKDGNYYGWSSMGEVKYDAEYDAFGERIGPGKVVGEIDKKNTILSGPAGLYDISEEDKNKLKTELIQNQINANTGKWFEGVESIPDIDALSFSHFYSLETERDIAGRKIKIKVNGVGGEEGLKANLNPDNWYWSFIPNDEHAKRKIMTSGPGSETMSLLDIPASGATYFLSGIHGAGQAITMMPAILTSGLYGTYKTTADLITGESPHQGYNNRWGNTMNSLMQPWYRADKGGNAVMEGAFMPITAAMHGVEWAGDELSDFTGQRWVGDTFKVGGNLAAIFYLGGKVYRPMGKGFKGALYNNPKVSGKSSFEAGTIDFINTLNDFKPFHYLADKTKTGVQSKITYPLMKQQWVRDIGLKFGYNFKKNFQLTEAAPWHYNKNYNVKKEKKLKFQLLPGKFTVPQFRKNKKTGKRELFINKEFEFKQYELYTFKDKGVFHFRDVVLKELIGDLSTLNFKEFNGIWGPRLKKYNISQGDIIKWSKHVYNTKQFGLKKNWKNYYQQKRLSETDPAKFSEIYEGKSNLGEPITADIISDKTITSIRRTNNPKNKKETILEIKNSQKNINKQVIYPDAKSANIALSDLNSSIASYAEIYKGEIYSAHAEVLTDFLANKDSKDLSFRYNRSILEPNANVDKISVKSVEIPDQTTTAVLDVVSDIMKENFEIFKRNPNNSIITVSRTPKGTKISIELLSAKENRQLNLDFGRKNNSTVTNSDEGVLVKSDNTNMHTFERTDKILNVAQDVIKGNPLEIPEPTSFSKAYDFKEDLTHQIDKMMAERQNLENYMKDIKDASSIKMVEDKIKNIDSVLETLYSNLDAIDNAFANGQVPIERLYHGSRITKQITEKDFDINKNKIDPYIEEGSPITLAKKIDPQLWSKLMKNKEYKASEWLVATKLLDAYIKKNPGKLINPDSEYLMFRRMDPEAGIIKVPEFYNIKEGKFYSPSHDVAKWYSRKPGDIKSIDVPEIDAKYSLAEKPFESLTISEKKLRLREEADAKLRKKYGDDIKIVRDELVGKDFNIEENLRVDNRVSDPTLPEGKVIIGSVARNKPAIWKDGKLIKPASVELRVGTKKLTYKEKLAKYKEDLRQWKEEEGVRKELGMKSEPAPVKPKASIKKESIWKEDIDIIDGTAFPRNIMGPDKGRWFRTTKGAKSVPLSDIISIKSADSYPKGLQQPAKGETEKGVLFHVTPTINIPAIKKEGLTVDSKRTPLWNRARGGEYGEGEIYAFENLNDALGWSIKMEFDLNIPMSEISIVKINKEPSLVKPKAPVVKKPEKIAKTVDIKKGRIRALTAKEINELTPQAQKKYLRDKEQELYDVAKKRLKLTDADMDKLGTDWLQKLNARERAVQKAIKAQLVKVEGIIKARKEANDLFTWYRPGTENRNISQKKPVDMPVEIKERLNELAPLEQKIASTKKQLETVKNNTDEYYILENQLKQAQKEHSEYHKENLKEVSVSLENTVKELRNDLRAVQKKQLTLSKEQIKKHKDTIVAAENLRGRINKAIADKLSLDEFRETKSNIIPGLTKLLKFIDLKKQLAKIRKTAPTYTPEQIDFIVNEKYVSIPNEEHIVTNPELFARNSQYKKALDTVYKIEAKLDKEYKFGNKINKEVPKFIDSWDIITHIENRILPKNQRVGNRLIDGDTPQALAKRINDNPKIKRIIKEYQTRIENVRKDINKELLLLGKEEYIQFLENYIPHMWDIKGQKSLDFVKKWTKSTPNIKKRKIPTYAEGIKMGLKPKLDNLGEIYQKYVHANYVMVRNNKLLHQLKNARDVNGNSIIFTNNGLSSARERVLKEIDYAKKNNFPEEYIERLQNEADGFDIKNYDKFEQEYVMRVFGKMKDGTLIAGKDPVYIHKDYAPVIKPFAENAYILPRKAGQLYSGMNNLFKQAFFLVSFFHPIALTESAVAALGFGGQGVGKFNPGRGFALLFEQNPVTGKRKIIQRPHKIGRQLIESEAYDDFIRHGGTRDNSSIDYHHSSLTGMMDKMLRYRQSKKGLQKAALSVVESLRIPKWLLEKNNKMLWEHYHQGLKVFTWNDVVGKITREFPEVDQYMLKSLVAEFVNDAFGGQNNYKLPISKMNKIWNDPNYRRRLGHILLAPDWTLSVQQQFYKAIAHPFKGRGDAVRQFYGNDPLLGKITSKTYFRYWAMNFGIVVAGVEFVNWLLHRATGDDDYNYFGDGPLNVDISNILVPLYKSGALELVGIDKEKTDRWIKQHENRPLVAGFGKQFKEVLNPYFSVLEAVIGLGYGNNIKHELADFTEEERKIFSNKVAPGISLMHELATGTTVGGFKLPESHLDDKFSREWWEYKLGHVKEKLIPISLKGTNFALSLPLGQKLSLYKGRQEIDRLLTIYAEGDAQFDIMNDAKMGHFVNIKYPDYVSQLKNLMPKLLEEIQKNNPKTNVMKLFEEQVAAKRSHYMSRFMQEFHPIKEGKERPWSSIRIGRLNRYALNMARLHKSGKMLHESLKNSRLHKFDPYYSDPAYQEYMDFADSLINNMPYGDGTIPTKFGNRVEYDIWKDTLKSVNYKKKIVLELDEE